MCPLTSFPDNEGPFRFSPASVKDWQPCRKSVISACERCRRRKIRCNDGTPCSTCKRFSLHCIRPQKPPDVVASEHQAALEGRIYQLESQLAARVTTPMQDMTSLEQNSGEGTSPLIDWHNLPTHLNLGTALPSSFAADDSKLRGFTKSGSMPPISVADYEPTTRLAPTSSPPQSIWPNTVRASSLPLTPVPSKFAPNFQDPSRIESTAAPLEPDAAPSWEFIANTNSSRLKFEVVGDVRHSRKRSASPLSMDSDGRSMAPSPEAEVDLLPLDPAPSLPRQGLLAAQHMDSSMPGSSYSSFTDRSRALSSTPMPSLFEAKTLTADFIQYIQSLEPVAYSISPYLFSQLCQIVYPNPHRATSELSVSMQMARFHVFLAMAIAMKLRIRDTPKDTNTLLDTCYELAIQQSSASTFWQENGSQEAAQLLSVFASIRKTSNNNFGPLQQSSSW